MEAKLDKLVEILSNQEATSNTNTRKTTRITTSSIWCDKDKLEKIKAPPTKSVLVVKKAYDHEKCVENQSVVEAAIMNNNIPVVESFQNKAGDLMIVCESEDTRSELKNICQNIGHYARDCPTKTVHVCGNCSEIHSTKMYKLC